MQEVKLLKAVEADIPTICGLATTIWTQHYPAIISREQISYMLGSMYSEQGLLEQMREKKHTFYFVILNGIKTGFISIHREQEDQWFINKFYIDQLMAGKGVGSKAFKALCDVTRADTFRLTVNRKNFKAINFYFKNGFTIECVADFDIGNGFEMNDFVMKWEMDVRI